MIRIGSNAIIGSIILVLLTTAFSAPVGAQSTSTRLEGYVWDSSGEPVSAATVTAVEENTGWRSQVVSNDDGYYMFIALQPGTYTVSVKAKGFREAIRNHLSLLFPGSVTETFTVDVAASETVTAVQELPRLNDSAPAGAFSRRDLEALPLLVRNPLLLAAYQPGVQINGGNEAISTINGTRQGMNSISMDGIWVTDQTLPNLGRSMLAVNPEVVQELRIVGTGSKAEYGQSGGGQLMMISRHGAKSWSKEIYDYFRNQRLNANDFFNNLSNVSRPNFTQNTFGANASGHFGDKTLFFANFEGNRLDQKIVRNRQVLTSIMKTGIFQWYIPGTATLQTYDIAANDPRHLGIDPSIAALIAKLPDPNNISLGDGLNTSGYLFKNPIFSWSGRIATRLDRNLSDNHQIFLRFSLDHLNATDVLNYADAPFPGSQEGTLAGQDWGIVAGSNWALSPQKANELRIGYLRQTTDLKRPARLTTPMLLANSWTNPLVPYFPGSNSSPIIEIADNFSHAKGAHIFKYGFAFRRALQNIVDNSGVYPNVTFGSNWGNVPAASIGPSVTSVISSSGRRQFEYLYNDLLGRIESVSQTFYSNLSSFSSAGTGRSRSYAFQEYAGFIQDDWRIWPNLTLNLGLRYEINSVPKERNGLQEVLDPASQVGKPANFSGFTARSGSGLYANNLKDFAPRAGFVWDIFSTGRTVLRGGYGIYYDRLIGAITNFVNQNGYGFLQTVSAYPNLAGTDMRLSDGIPALTKPQAPILKLPATRSSSIVIFDPNLRTPRIDQFNLTLEKRMFGNTVFEASYVGTRGRKLFQHLNLNQTKTTGDFLKAFQQLQTYRAVGTPVPPTNTLMRIFGSPIAAMNAIGGSIIDTGQAGAAADIVDLNYYGKYAAAGVSDYYLRNFPQFDKFIVGSSTALSWYDSLQLGMHTRGSSYYLGANYIWSKSFDTVSADGAGFVSPSDSFNPELNRAPSDFDRTRVLNVTGSYMLPLGKNRRFGSEMEGFRNSVLGCWNLGFLWIWESGARFSVASSRETLYAGVTSLANYTGSHTLGSLYRGGDGIYWFTSDQTPLFTLPASGEGGSSGRNSFMGPHYFNLDVSLYKNFSLGERKSMQFRIEAYNMLNKANFGLPDTNISNTTFGKIFSVQGSARTIRLALRYQF